tara:strand:- start:128 stop:358 length:231 start_codon:yes stop_codon:yes gene_type:complete
MNVLEICNRPNNSTFENEEIIFVVEQYIKETKRTDIDIHLTKNMNRNMPLFELALKNQLSRLNIAFDFAQKHFIGK